MTETVLRKVLAAHAALMAKLRAPDAPAMSPTTPAQGRA